MTTKDETNPKGQADRKADISRLTANVRAAYSRKAYEDALEASRVLLALDPDNFVGQRTAARIYSQGGQNDLAEPIWRRLCETATDKVEPAIYLARIAYAKADWDEMAQFADIARREDPNHVDGLRLAIQARVKARQTSDLPDMLAQLYRLDAERTLALLRTMSGADLAQAQAGALSRIRDQEPDDPSLSAVVDECRDIWRQGAERAGGRREEAIAAGYLRAMLAFDPRDEGAAERLNLISRQPLRRLRKAVKSGDPVEILDQAEATINFNPSLFEGWLAIARFAPDDQLERIAESYGMCVKMRPDDVYYAYLYGVALLKAGRGAEAIDILDSVIARISDPADPLRAAATSSTAGLRRTVFQSALVEARAGRLQEARAQYGAVRARVRDNTAEGENLGLADRTIFWCYVLLASVRKVISTLSTLVKSLISRSQKRGARIHEQTTSRKIEGVGGSRR